MKKLLAVVIFEVTPLFAMEAVEVNSPPYRLINSFLEAYMAQRVELEEGSLTTIYDYEDPETGYVITLKQANTIIFDVTGEIAQVATTRKVPPSFDVLIQKAAIPLTEKMVYYLQMAYFARFNLDDFVSDEASEWKGIKSNRLWYKAAWATHDPEKIKKVLSIKLYDNKEKFTPLKNRLGFVKERLTREAEGTAKALLEPGQKKEAPKLIRKGMYNIQYRNL